MACNYINIAAGMHLPYAPASFLYALPVVINTCPVVLKTRCPVEPRGHNSLCNRQDMCRLVDLKFERTMFVRCNQNK